MERHSGSGRPGERARENGDDDLPAPWGAHELTEAVVAVELGSLRLRFRQRHGEIWIATREEVFGRRAEARESAAPSTAPGEWVRWPVAESATGIVLRPILPDRTVVAEPDAPLRLVPEASARVFVRVPLWVRVETGEGTPLLEIPTTRLSDTWQGNFSTGELCYWLETTARRRIKDAIFRPHLAVCPLELTNRSAAEAPVERIVVHVRHLHLYRDEGRFWSNDSRIRFRGVEEASHLDTSAGPPAEAPGAMEVAPPRDLSPPGASKILGLVRLRALPGFGG